MLGHHACRISSLRKRSSLTRSYTRNRAPRCRSKDDGAEREPHRASEDWYVASRRAQARVPDTSELLGGYSPLSHLRPKTTLRPELHPNDIRL